MLFAAGNAHGQLVRAPLQLSGFGAADPAVMAMQQALQSLSARALNPSISPGPATGEVNTQTMNAIVNALDMLTKQLPDLVAAGLRGGLSGGVQSTEAKNFVAQYAAIIAEAATVAAATMPAPNPISSVAYNVQQSPWIIVMLLGAAFIGYRLFFSKPATQG